MGGIAGGHPLPAAALRRVQSCGPAGGAAVRHHGAAGAGHSPEAVAEHAMALAANRRICKAYIKVRNNNFSLDGLLGYNLYGSAAGMG